jgi:hypothetical protein
MPRGFRALAAAGALVALAPGAGALDLAGDRAELHGWAELQLRAIARDFDASDDWDLTQWANVLDLELEADLAPGGWGPFDAASFFARVEVRYDCVWTRGCGIFQSANAYGDEIRRVPRRLIDARRPPYLLSSGRLPVSERPYWYELRDGSRKPLLFWQTPLAQPFFFDPGTFGNDGLPVSGDEPSLFLFSDLLSGQCIEWAARHRKEGSRNGFGPGQTLLLDPSCDVQPIAAIADRRNPLRQDDWHSTGIRLLSRPLPFRPGPELDFDTRAGRASARGVYTPNARLRDLLEDGELRALPLEIGESDLEWNHGAWQQDQRELRELYVDLEAFDSRLWLRAGYQLVVWGKTDLFRQQDQVNPADLALASLPTLEEARIPLWALRAVWSFYDVGPLRDVRLEGVLLVDSYQADDVGTCGEPYTVLAACAFSVDSVAHGYTGAGLAGMVEPPAPWEDVSGLEGGLRLEWRWDSASFALSDFYGYRDAPWVDTVFRYARNVDPETGRPRRAVSAARCDEADGPGCLDPDDALTDHHANQQLFALICASTLALVPAPDRSGCLPTAFGDPRRTDQPGILSPRVVVALDAILSGDFGNSGLIFPGLAGFPTDGSAQLAISRMTYNGQAKVTVDLNRDPDDGGPDYTNQSPGNPLLRASDFSSTVAFF